MTSELFALVGGKSAVAVVTLIVLMGSIGALLFWVVAVPVLGGPEKIKQIFDASDDLNRLAGDINRAVNRPPPLPQRGVCGNGICEADENVHTCLLDCFVCNKNSICETAIGENENSCPADCTATTTPVCNRNNACEPDRGENRTNCADCRITTTPDDDPTDPIPTGSCGDNVCQTSESCSSCATDCGACTTTNTSCTDNSGVCQTSCGSGFESNADGAAQCSPLGKTCCTPSEQTSATNFFFDDFTTTAYINTASMQNVRQTASRIEPIAPPATGGEIDPASTFGNGLVALWHLNGNATDASGNGYHGTLNGTANCTVSGKFNQACQFGGSADSIATEDLANIENALSFSMWIKSNSPESTNYYFFGKGSNPITIRSRWGSNETLRVELFSATDNADLFPIGTFLTDQQWHHLAVTYDGTTARLYIDSIEKASDTVSAPLNDVSNSLVFGSFNGLFDEVAVWNRALSTSEVTALFSAGGNPVYSGSFESTSIAMNNPNSLRVHWTDAGAGVAVSVSTDNGSHWCDMANDSNLSDSSCPLPAASFKYRVVFNANTSMDNIRFDWSTQSVQNCGNNLREGTEICDGTDLGGESCTSQGFSGGTLSCRSNCTGYTTTSCTSGGGTPVCGNDIIEGPETCDDGDLGGGDGCSATCQVESGFVCTGQPSRCTLVSTAVCGNGIVESGEQCDGANLNGQTCSQLGFFGGSLSCTIGCTLQTIQCTGATYSPPIGIPAPTFGILQSHRMYSGQTFAAGGFAYRDAGNGPYSHYVDISAANCTDTANDYGTQSTPRCTLPTTIPAGSVVELHGGPYPADIVIENVRGTVSTPVFIRGPNAAQKPRITARRGIAVEDSSYVLLENLFLDGSDLPVYSSQNFSSFKVYQHSDHIAIRNSEAANYPMPALGDGTNCAPSREGVGCYFASVWGAAAKAPYQSGEIVSDVVFYNNYIHDNGDYVPAWESGIHAFSLSRGVRNIWLLDNVAERNAEDGFQIFGGGYGDIAQYVYVGRNRFVNNGENAIDLKQSFDVVVSQNEFAGYRKTNFPESGSDGAAIVLNDDAPNDRLWILFNKVYDNTTGIRSQSSGNAYVIGNLFYDIRYEPGQLPPTSGGHARGVAIWSSSAVNFYAIGNTIYDVSGGIYANNGVNYYAYNNIVSTLNTLEDSILGYHTALGNTNLQVIDFQSNLFYHPSMAYRSRGLFACPNCILDVDPLFVNFAQNNFTLQAQSPAVNTGAISSVFDEFQSRYGLDIRKDLTGIMRPQQGAWDIGAYERS